MFDFLKILLSALDRKFAAVTSRDPVTVAMSLIRE